MSDVHGVDFLKGTVLGLNDEEEDDEDESTTADRENKTVVVVNGVGDEASEEGQQEVEDPVERSCDGQCAALVAEREDLSIVSPDERTPGDSKGDNSKACEGNHDLSWAGSGSRVGAVQLEVADKGEDEEAHAHPCSTANEHLATANLLDEEEREASSDEVDGAENELSDIRVADTSRLEDVNAIVEEVVDTSKLLSGGENAGKDGAVGHAGSSEDFAEVELAGLGSFLIELGLDIFNLVLDNWRVLGHANEASDGPARLIVAATAICITGAFGEEENGNSEDERPGEGESVGDSPRCTAVDLFGSVVDDFSKQNTKGNQKLPRRGNNTADVCRCALRLVDRDGDGEGADRKAGDETANCELNPVARRRNLNNCSNAGKEGSHGDGQATSERIGKFASGQSADQGANAEQADNGSLSGWAPIDCSIGSELAKTGAIVLHAEEAGDFTTVDLFGQPMS